VRERLEREYRKLKSISSSGLLDKAVSEHIVDTVRVSRDALQQARRIQLKSAVRDKTYFGFSAVAESRPVNQALYASDQEDFDGLLQVFLNGFRGASDNEIVRSAYTLAYTVFAANDINEIGRKASATFFEILIGHIMARAIGVSPRKRIRLPESDATLPTDYVFELGGNRRIHLPIKTSTRERGVQAWVHQLVLDGIFGKGSFVGVFVVGAETKRNAKTGEVIEICVPQQFAMFQARIATISGIYYLDPPETYLRLSRTNTVQPIQIERFGTMFRDLQALLHG